MQKFQLFYKNKKLSLFNKLDLSHLKNGAFIKELEKEAFEDETTNAMNTKSEIFEYDNEESLRAKENEEKRYLVTDKQNKNYQSVVQKVSDQSDYFVFVENGANYDIHEVDKWHMFMMLINAQENAEAADKLAKKIASVKTETKRDEGERDIDYAEHFDDDNEEDAVVFMEKERHLSTSGTKMQNLVEGLDVDAMQTWETENNEKEDDEDTPKRVKKMLADKDLIKIFGNKSLTIKDLLSQLKKLDFKLDEMEKGVVKQFLSKKCKLIASKDTKEKFFKLI